MGKRDELNERALLAASLRRKKMTVPDIARYLCTSERQVFRYLNRAHHLYRLLAKASDGEKHLGETLTVFYENEQEALAKFAAVNPGSNVAVAYLNAARDARKEIKKLLQESGLIKKVAEKLEVTGLPLQHDPVRDAFYAVLELAEEFKKKQAEHESPNP
jgi:predicted transcriptional regulator